MTRAVAPHMIGAGWGRVVSVSSVSALGDAGRVGYASAKAGLIGFTRTLAVELGPHGITVNAIAPGFISTGMTARTARRLGREEAEHERIAATSIPAGRVGRPEDVAHAASYRQRRRGLRVGSGAVRRRRPGRLMGARGTLVLAVACGVAVGTLYFPQALTPLVASGLGVSPDAAALAATAPQLGYAVGIFAIVPLGDRITPRTLVVTLFTLTAAALAAAAAAPSLAVLAAMAAATGVVTVSAQVIAPMAAANAGDERRGQVLGTLLSGSIAGMLLGRALAGVAGEELGWRAPYAIAAAISIVLAAVLAARVPRTTPPERASYPALLAEPLRLLRTEPELRRSCLYQATIFAGFSAVWTSVALLLAGPRDGLGAGGAGLLALVGAATMLCTPRAGAQVDRRGPDAVNGASLGGVLAAAAVLLGGGAGGPGGLVALAAGVLALDVAMQCGMVANHARVFAIAPAAGSRLNTAYMTCAFAGGSLGSWLGVRAYGLAGWTGVCALTALLAAVAVARHLAHLRRRRLPSWTTPSTSPRSSRCSTARSSPGSSGTSTTTSSSWSRSTASSPGTSTTRRTTSSSSSPAG